MLKRTCAVVFLLAAVACGRSASAPTSPSPDPTPTSPGPGAGGIAYDNIQAPHQFIIGSPVPTQNQADTYCCWPLPVLNAGKFLFDLFDFPLGILPSGGASNVVSASEVLFAGLNVSPATAKMTFQWHRAVGQDTVIYTYSTGSSSSVWAYSYIGHFSWEIREPGAYYLLVDTSRGSARIDFAITETMVANFWNDGLSYLAPNGVSSPESTLARPGGGGGSGWVIGP